MKPKKVITLLVGVLTALTALLTALLSLIPTHPY